MAKYTQQVLPLDERCSSARKMLQTNTNKNYNEFAFTKNSHKMASFFV